MTTDPTPSPDVRELAADALFRSAMNGLGDWSTEIDDERGYWRSHAAAVLAAVSPVIRRQVAEEIADDITETIGGYPGNEARRPHVDRGELLNDAHWAAAIARTHAHPEEGK